MTTDVQDILKTQVVYGRFYTDSGPVRGIVQFLPGVPWISCRGKAYAVKGAIVELDEDGRFSVELTRSDVIMMKFGYKVLSPAGQHMIVVKGDQPLALADLL